MILNNMRPEYLLLEDTILVASLPLLSSMQIMSNPA